MAYIDNRLYRGTTMDAQKADRIADLLVQIRKKYKNLDPITDFGAEKRQIALDLVDALLGVNDELGEMTAKGWV